MGTVYKEYTQVKVSVDESGVALVTLNRPEVGNAWTHVMANELIELYSALEADDRVRVVVVTGAGRFFCQGADLRQGDFSTKASVIDDKRNADADSFRDGGGRVSVAVARLRKPTIAAINGAAVGVGITSTLPMDIRITHEANKIGFVFTRRGIVPEASSTYFLPKLVGASRALALFVPGQVHPASSHLLTPLWHTLVQKPEQVLPTALALAKEIAERCSLVSTVLVKQMVYHGGKDAFEQHLLDSKMMYLTGNGPDAKEGVQSFKDKRDPKFPGTVRDVPAQWWKDADVSPAARLAKL